MSSPDPKTVARITALIRDKLSVDVPDDDTDLIRSGVLDSLALVMLIVALEQEFTGELPLDAFNLDHFRSVERIADLVLLAGMLEAGT